MTITYANHRDTEITENAQSLVGLRIVRVVDVRNPAIV